MRKSTGKRLRFEIFKRDGFRCAYCGATPVQKVLRVDHVKPVAEGGTDDPSNLITACFDCNAGKAAVPLEERKLATGIATEADREHAEQIREWLAIQRDVLEAKDEVGDYLVGKWDEACSSSGARNRLKKAAAEFGVQRVVEAIGIVGEKRLGRSDETPYFHGILRRWRADGSPPPTNRMPGLGVPEGMRATESEMIAAVVSAAQDLSDLVMSIHCHEGGLLGLDEAHEANDRLRRLLENKEGPLTWIDGYLVPTSALDRCNCGEAGCPIDSPGAY